MAVSVAALDTLSSLDQVYTIEPRHLAAVAGGTAEQVTRALAADEVLASQVRRGDSGVVVSLSRSDRQGQELWSEKLTGPDDPDRLISTIQEALLRAYDGRKKRRAAHRSTATPQDYETYLEIKSVLRSAPKPMEYSTAMGRLKHVRESSPGLLGAYFMEASIGAYLYRITRNQEYLEQGREALEAAGKVAPGDYRVMMAEVENAIAGRDFERAENYLGEVRKVAPDHPLLPLHSADLLAEQGNTDDATALMRGVVENRPSWLYLRELASLELRSGSIASAREHLAAAVELAPEYPPLLAKAAEVELIHGDPAKAEALLVTAVSKTASTLYMTNLGTAFMLQGRYSEAQLPLLRAYRLNSRDPVLLINLGDTLHLSKEDGEAIKYYEEALGVLNGNELGIFIAMKAYCLSSLGRIDEAVSVIGPVAETEGEQSIDISYLAALVYARANDEKSERFGNQAKAMGLSDAWFELAAQLL
jgi:tetratricopeptide (TPR) repeat protein